MQLTAEHKTVLSRITTRLLNQRVGTPALPYRKQLGPKRKSLDDLLNARLIRIVNDAYLPTFRGIQSLDEDIRQIVKDSLNSVLLALQRLYQSDDRTTFGLNVVVDSTKQINPSRDVHDVLPALVLGEELELYHFPTPLSFDTVHSDGVLIEHHVIIPDVLIHETILDFTSVAERWQRLLKQQSQREEMPARLAPGIAEDDAEIAGEIDFGFMKDDALREIVGRDYSEFQRIKRVDAFKSQFVLCGGLIETILLDRVRQVDLTKSRKAPRVKGIIRPVDEWGLGELIDVAHEVGLITADVERFSHGVRNYRNLIHPSKELQSGTKMAKEEATIAEKVLEIVIRELKH
jgi:hypothetical protein